MTAMETKRKTKFSLSIVALGLILLSFQSRTMAAQTANSPEQSNAVPEEVFVTSRKLFRTLEKEIREAEDHMYALFNELNDDNLYDVNCGWEKEFGTRVRTRICRPVFVKQSTTQEAEWYYNQVTVSGGGGDVRTISNHAPSVQSEITYHYPILEKKFKEVLTDNKDLLEAVIHHHELRETLKEKKSSVFGFKKD